MPDMTARLRHTPRLTGDGARGSAVRGRGDARRGVRRIHPGLRGLVRHELVRLRKVHAVAPLGVDTLDSCNPTRIARHGMLLCKSGAIKIKQVGKP